MPPGSRRIGVALGLLVLAGLTLLVSDPSVRFERIVPGLAALADSEPAGLPTEGAIAWRRVSEGLAAEARDAGGGRLRWARPAPLQFDKLRLTGSVSLGGAAPDIRPRQRAQLDLVQPGRERTLRRTLTRWPAAATRETLDRLVDVPDPSRPLWIELALTPRSGQILLHRLDVDGLATRPGVEGLRWALLCGWLAVLIATLRVLARPMAPPLSRALWVALTLMMVGLLSPPDLLREAKDLVAILLPQGPPGGARPDTHALAHFALFAALAIPLFWGRRDLGWLRLTALLAALAGATELMQLLVDGRQADWHDVAVDLAGVGAAATLVWVARRTGWSGGDAHPT